jgi:hypothetical protein
VPEIEDEALVMYLLKTHTTPPAASISMFLGLGV